MEQGSTIVRACVNHLHNIKWCSHDIFQNYVLYCMKFQYSKYFMIHVCIYLFIHNNNTCSYTFWYVQLIFFLLLCVNIYLYYFIRLQQFLQTAVGKKLFVFLKIKEVHISADGTHLYKRQWTVSPKLDPLTIYR